MTFSTALKLMPLALVVACESKPVTTSAPPVAAPPKAVVARPKPVRDSMQTFTWQDEMCESTGTFPAGAYTQRQLRDTYQVATGFMLTTTTVAFNFSQYNAAFFTRAAASLRHEHDSLATLLHGLHVVPVAYWRQMKHLRELQLAEDYALNQAQLEAYLQPESLLHNPYYAHCAGYADALTSTDTAAVLRAWHKLVDEQKAINGYPELLEKEYLRESARPEGFAYGKMQLLTFGWSNCANELSKYNRLDEKGEPLNKFGQLFKHVEQANCVDAD